MSSHSKKILMPPSEAEEMLKIELNWRTGRYSRQGKDRCHDYGFVAVVDQFGELVD